MALSPPTMLGCGSGGDPTSSSLQYTKAHNYSAGVVGARRGGGRGGNVVIRWRKMGALCNAQRNAQKIGYTARPLHPPVVGWSGR